MRYILQFFLYGGVCFVLTPAMGSYPLGGDSKQEVVHRYQADTVVRIGRVSQPKMLVQSLVPRASPKVTVARVTTSEGKKTSNRILRPQKKAPLGHRLDLSGGNLLHVSPQLKSLTELRLLNLDDNQLTDLPESLRDLVHLSTLSIKRNQLKKIPSVVALIPFLEVLCLNENQIRCLDEDLFKAKQLVSLDVSENPIGKISPAIGGLQKLKKLRFFGCRNLGQIPSEIAMIQSLLHLDLALCDLTAIPDELTGMKNLVRMDLNDNHLEALPDNWDGMTALTFLDICFNEIKHIPDSLYENPNLDLRKLGNSKGYK